MQKPTLDFNFTEIPLDEAVNAVIAGDGNYSEIKSVLLNKLPTLETGKAFAFGMPNGKEVPEDQRRGICTAINSTLKKAKIFWKVTYSGTKKLFICVPKGAPGIYRTKTNGNGDPRSHLPIARGNNIDTEKEIVRLRGQGMSAREIANETKFPYQRIQYILYQKYAKGSSVPLPKWAQKTLGEKKQNAVNKQGGK